MFSHFREYPCDHVAMLNLAVLNVGSPRMSTHETALKLLRLLDARFLQEDVVFDTPRPTQQPLNDVMLATTYSSSQMSLSEQLAALHTDLTMPMFSGWLTVVMFDVYEKGLVAVMGGRLVGEVGGGDLCPTCSQMSVRASGRPAHRSHHASVFKLVDSGNDV